MRSTANVTSFLLSGVPAQAADQVAREPPLQIKLLSAISQVGRMPLRDLPSILKLDPKQTVELVERARSLGEVEVYELEDVQKSKLLFLTSQGYGALSRYTEAGASTPA